MKILITGGGSEIGFAIAERRLKLGDEVIITASSQASLQAAQERFSALGYKVNGFVFELSNPLSAERDLNAYLENRLDAVVLNAATRTKELKRFHEISDEDLQASINANIYGNTWILRKILPYFLSQEFGRLVFISSGSAASGTSRFGAYCLTKAAIEGLFLNLAVDYSHKNICSNIVRPGVIATERNKKYWSRPAYTKRLSSYIPAGRLGTPLDVAMAIDPLVARDCYMTGAVVAVTGGLPLARTEGALDV